MATKKVTDASFHADVISAETAGRSAVAGAEYPDAGAACAGGFAAGVTTMPTTSPAMSRHRRAAADRTQEGIHRGSQCRRAQARRAVRRPDRLGPRRR